MLEVVLAAIPLLLLVGSLLFGFYPGCETIVRLAARIGAARRRSVAAARPRPSLRQAVARGGLLIAFGHAQRPPPPSA